jgi:hypothetical protein
MPLQLRDKSDFIPELTINAQCFWAKSVQHPFLQTVGVFIHIQTLVHQSLKLKSSNGGPRPSSLGKSHPPRLIRYYFFEFHLRFFFCLLLFLICSKRRDFNLRRGSITILLPRARGNLRPSRVHWSRISENPFQSSFVETPWMARYLQRLAPAPNCRLEKLV